VLRAAGETEIAQENIEDLLELDEGYWISASCLFTVFKRRLYGDIFLSALPIVLNFPVI
jgi:hypothetical protein